MTDLLSSGTRHIGLRKIVTNVEQRLAGDFGGGVAEAVSEIEFGTVATFAEAEKSGGSFAPVRRLEGDDGDLHLE